MNRKRNRNQGNNDTTKLDTPPRERFPYEGTAIGLTQENVNELLDMMDKTPIPRLRETSESTDLNEIEWLLATQRRNDEEIAQKKESLRARLNLLEEGMVGVRSQELGVRRGEAEEIERLKKEINDLSAENLALQETKKKNIEKYVVGIIVVLVIAIVIAFVCGQSINERKHQQQHQKQQHKERQVVPVPTPEPPVPTPLLTMTQTELDLLRSAGKLVNRDIDKYESVGDVLSAFYAESPMSVRDAVIERLGNIESPGQLLGALEDILGRAVIIDSVPRSFTDVPVEGFVASPSNVTPTHNGDVPESSGVLEKESEVRSQETVQQRGTFRRRQP